MTLKGVTFISLRLFAVYLFIQGVQWCSQLIQFGFETMRDLFRDSLWIAVVGVLVPGTVYFLFGALLWVGADFLAGRLAGERNGAPRGMDFSLKSLYVLAFTVFGLFFAIRSIPGLAQAAGQLLYLQRQGAEEVFPLYSQWPGRSREG